jgi:hypothetical protein
MSVWKVQLVGRGYVADQIEFLTGTRPNPRRVTSTLEWLDRNIGTYYSENERMLLGITSRLYRRAMVDETLKFLANTDYFTTKDRLDVDVSKTEA